MQGGFYIKLYTALVRPELARATLYLTALLSRGDPNTSHAGGSYEKHKNNDVDRDFIPWPELESDSAAKLRVDRRDRRGYDGGIFDGGTVCACNHHELHYRGQRFLFTDAWRCAFA